VAGEPRAPAALGLGVAAESAGFGLIGFSVIPAGEAAPRARLRLAEDAPLRIASGQPPAEEGALRAALGAEWHAREPGATWSFGHEALLPLRLDPPPHGAILLKAEVEGFRPAPDAPLIGFEALAGDRPLIRHAMRPGEARVVDIPIPAGTVGPDGTLDLLLRVDAVSSPFARGEGQDERPLGFRIGGLRIARQALLEEGRPVRFGQKPGAPPASPDPADMLVGGWFAREEGGCWSNGEDGALLLAPAPSLRPGWRLFLACRTIGGERERPARVALLLDNETLGHWDFTVTHAVVAEVPGIAARMAGRGSATLGLRRIGAASPLDLGLGDDRRRLGLMLAAAVVVGPVDAEDRARRLLVGLDIGLGALPPLRQA
jgi:hypothetical protein